ncbi:MAG TPA: PTS sugar transporter subunit IIA [bacterium]|nr:PTS sugar transporter subunit IIA [bacterium]
MTDVNTTPSSLAELILPKTIRLDLQGKTKQGVIDELIELIADAGLVRDKSAVRQAVIERERKLSTGLGHGIAIPHGKTDAVDKLVGAFGIKREGIHFDSADGAPAKIFFLLISPVTVTGPHIKALSGIARFLRVEKNRERLLQAASVDEIISLLGKPTV